MEQLIAFVTTPAGKALCAAFLLIGVTDVLIAWIFLGKVVKQHEQKISMGMPPQEKQPVQDKVRSLKNIIKLITTMGIAMAVFGIFGLTR